MAKVLIVEDDSDLAGMLADWLGFEHFTVERASDGADGLEKLRCGNYDLVILDWDLPEVSGVEVCKTFRSEGGDTPVIMLTGKSAISEKEAGLDAGADDYLTKPFSVKELSARIRAVLRRYSGQKSNVLQAGDIVLDPSKYIVTKRGVEVTLLPKEFALLEFLMRHPNEVFSAEALIHRVWASDSEATNDAIRTCLKRLRKKIDDDDEKTSIIQTLHGVGYRLRR